MSATGQARNGQRPATLNATEAERRLITVFQTVQAAAKQRQRMEAEDEDAATTFSTEGYLIGERLNPNRAALLQNAAALQSKAAADSLPGDKTAEQLKTIADAIAAYAKATASAAEQEQEAEADRIARDRLLRKINSRRMAIQHAADSVCDAQARIFGVGARGAGGARGAATTASEHRDGTLQPLMRRGVRAELLDPTIAHVPTSHLSCGPCWPTTPRQEPNPASAAHPGFEITLWLAADKLRNRMAVAQHSRPPRSRPTLPRRRRISISRAC